jgi:pimeloyl-ACP methyl ester carboxylesterase
MARLVSLLAAAIPTGQVHRIEGSGHAAPFDATAAFVQLIADTQATTTHDQEVLTCSK